MKRKDKFDLIVVVGNRSGDHGLMKPTGMHALELDGGKRLPATGGNQRQRRP
jgi:hypothetical protein